MWAYDIHKHLPPACVRGILRQKSFARTARRNPSNYPKLDRPNMSEGSCYSSKRAPIVSPHAGPIIRCCTHTHTHTCTPTDARIGAQPCATCIEACLRSPYAKFFLPRRLPCQYQDKTVERALNSCGHEGEQLEPHMCTLYTVYLLFAANGN